jgi:hypothetical protein
MADDLYGALGRRASLDNRSISQEVIEIIKTYLATSHCRHSGDEEALQMAGSWDDSRSAAEIVSQLRSERANRRIQETL